MLNLNKSIITLTIIIISLTTAEIVTYEYSFAKILLENFAYFDQTPPLKFLFGDILIYRYMKCSLSAGGSLGNYCPSPVVFNTQCSPCPGVNLMTYSFYMNLDYDSLGVAKLPRYSMSPKYNNTQNIYNIYTVSNKFSIINTTTVVVSPENYAQSCSSIISNVTSIHYNSTCNSSYIGTTSLSFKLPALLSTKLTVKKDSTLQDCYYYIYPNSCYYSYFDLYCYYTDLCYTLLNQTKFIQPGISQIFSLDFNTAKDIADYKLNIYITNMLPLSLHTIIIL